MRRGLPGGLLALALGLAASAAGQTTSEPVLPPRGTLIAHALGGVGGREYTNSLAALERSWARGFRWFEADVTPTADHQLVCVHEGLEAFLGLPGRVRDLTLAQVLAGRIGGVHPPLSLVRLLEEFQARPGSVLVVDSKQMTPGRLELVEAAVSRVDPGLRRRLVLECYRSEDVDLVRRAERLRGAFGAVAYANYVAELPAGDLVRLVSAHTVALVLLPVSGFNRELAAAVHRTGARVVVHAVNDCQELARLGEAGADAVMTDFCAPSAGP